MAYRTDPDLEFLASIPSRDLDDLVRHLTHDKDGSARLTEELTYSESYKMYYPDHRRYWREIAAEIQCFGANSFATLFRGGKGVLYKEVLTDVCEKMNVSFNSNASVVRIEQALLFKVLEDALEQMSPQELRSIAEEFNFNPSNLTPQAMMAAAQTVFIQGGFASYQLSMVVANAVSKALLGKGLTFAANSTLTKGLSILTGPVGWAITGAWTAIDLAGAAYRVTIPAVFMIATLRQSYLNG
ncbi:DUF3944 domain-containing protein [Moraxella sp. ZJ142]|uniref:DUF3944 domain-containing protein n=1 Tax=Moraxella marmotae TaxID=3344520 RepID=UPI0035D4D58B